MSIPDVHGLGAKVLALLPGARPFEGYVTGYGGDGTQLDRNAEWYYVEPQQPYLCLIQRLPPDQVKRIVRATTPRGESFEGAAFGTIRDQNEQIVGYNISYIHEPFTVRYAEANWIQPL
jgi:hypothetical protein